MSFGKLLHTRFQFFEFQVTNHCNLHCEHCSTLCDQPLHRDSPYLWRRSLSRMQPELLQAFCDRFQGVGHNDYHRLIGGEPTAMRLDHLRELIDILYQAGRLVSLRTNGFGVRLLGERHIRRCARIILDDHGINSEVVDETVEWLEKFYTADLSLRKIHCHYDLRKAAAVRRGRPRPCSFWLTSVTLHWTGVVHPCCVTPWLQAYNNDTRMDDELRAAGWSIDNPDLVATMRNWHNTMPAYVREQCQEHCWMLDLKRAPAARISLKPNDVLRRKP